MKHHASHDRTVFHRCISRRGRCNRWTPLGAIHEQLQPRTGSQVQRKKEKPVGAKLCNSLFEESRRIVIEPQDRLTADPSIYRSLTLPLLRRARKRMSGTAMIVRILEGDEPSSFGGSLGPNCLTQAMKKHPNSGHRIAVLMLFGPKG